MISNEIWILAGTAVGLGCFHTLVGPDHYLPFIAMAKARSWPLKKTLTIAFLSGLGHVLSSVMLGFLGLALGIAVGKLNVAESWRGNAASWLFSSGACTGPSRTSPTSTSTATPTAAATNTCTSTKATTPTSMSARKRPTSPPGSSSPSSSSAPASR
jgi:hypothetical protein